MSTASHESYTRIWGINVCPVFSIEYRLAPQFPFPSAVDDIWQAYNWIIENCEKKLRIKPEKVLIVGDSAGGNLAAALTVLLVKTNSRIPEGLVLYYPVLSLESDHVSPSTL